MGRPKRQLDSATRLLVDVSRGNRRAFERLYVAYCEAVHDFLCRRISPLNGHDCEDMVQEVFVRAWVGRCRFRARSSAKTYLLGIAKNVAKESHRRRLRSRSLSLDGATFLVPAPTSSSPGPEEVVDRREQFQVVLDTLGQLSDEQRQAIELIHVRQLGFGQAADVAGCSVAAFEGRYRRARRRLQGLLTPLGTGPRKR